MLLDTSFLVDLLAGRPEAKSLSAELDSEGHALRIPTPVLFELWQGAIRSSKSELEKSRVEDLLLAFEVAPLGVAEAQAAGNIQAARAGRGRPLGTVDVLVAGIAAARGEAVVTGDAGLASLAPEVTVRQYARRAR